MYDPALKLFLDDEGLLVRERLYRQSQRLHREAADAVLAANGEDEGSGIGYSSVLYDETSRQFKLWYLPHKDYLPRLAVSEDAQRRRRCSSNTSCLTSRHSTRTRTPPAKRFSGTPMPEWGRFSIWSSKRALTGPTAW